MIMFTIAQFITTTKYAAPLVLAVSLLTSCSGKETTKSATTAASDHIAKVSEKTVYDSFNTATSPLDDLGIRQNDIPEELQKLVKSPYTPLPKMSCTDAKAELAKLDALLGPDMDVQHAIRDSKELGFDHATGEINVAIEASDVIDAGGDFLHDSVVGFVRSQTSFLPFRNVIRQITGVNKHEKDLAKAQQAGQLRRAYIKGAMQASTHGKCQLSPPPPAPPIEEARAEMAK